MNEALCKKQIECYRQYIQLLELAKTVAKEVEGKTYTKRVLTKLEDKIKELELPFHIYQDGIFDRDEEGKVSIRAFSKDRAINGDFISDYDFIFYISFSTKRIINSEKTIELLNSHIESRENNIKKYEDTMEQYEELKRSKKEIQKLIEEHNAKVHYLFQELKIK